MTEAPKDTDTTAPIKDDDNPEYVPLEPDPTADELLELLHRDDLRLERLGLNEDDRARMIGAVRSLLKKDTTNE